MSARCQVLIGIAFLLGALLGGVYVFVFEPAHSHNEILETEV